MVAPCGWDVHLVCGQQHVLLIRLLTLSRFKLLLNGEPGVEEDSYDVILSKGVEQGVLALPGAGFFPNGRKTAYVRAAFSIASEQEVDEALKRLRDVIIAARATNRK